MERFYIVSVESFHRKYYMSFLPRRPNGSRNMYISVIECLVRTNARTNHRSLPGDVMALLCAITIAQSVASALRETAKTKAELHDIADAVEVMKEILGQISVNPIYQDHSDAVSFCHCCLYTLRAVLFDWTYLKPAMHANLAACQDAKGRRQFRMERQASQSHDVPGGNPKQLTLPGPSC